MGEGYTYTTFSEVQNSQNQNHTSRAKNKTQNPTNQNSPVPVTIELPCMAHGTDDKQNSTGCGSMHPILPGRHHPRWEIRIYRIWPGAKYAPTPYFPSRGTISVLWSLGFLNLTHTSQPHTTNHKPHSHIPQTTNHKLPSAFAYCVCTYDVRKAFLRAWLFCHTVI
eukprot:scaffold10531_cov37-Tisochrysis_lutea.AAC.3